MMETAVVTGVAGFTARHLTRLVRERLSSRLVGFDRCETARSLDLDEYHHVDLTRAEDVERAIEGTRPDLVFHLAGVADGEPSNIYKCNVVGTINLLEALARHVPYSRVLLVGSAAEYGDVSPEASPVNEEQPCNPIGHYGISKHAMTLAGMVYSRQTKLKIVVARPFNIIGAGISTNLLLGAILRRIQVALERPAIEPTIKVGNLDPVRDFIAVEDAAEAYLSMMQAGCWGEILNVCSGQPTSVRQLVDLAIECSGSSMKIEIDPSLVRRQGTAVIYGDPSKARARLGFMPKKSLRDAVRSAWDAVQQVSKQRRT